MIKAGAEMTAISENIFHILEFIFNNREIMYQYLKRKCDQLQLQEDMYEEEEINLTLINNSQSPEEK
jgi:hypothetical protein